MAVAWVGAALVALSAVGFLDALYFILVTHRWMRPDPAWLPRAVCMDEGTCARVVDTPYARVLGLPNAAFGAAWYVLTAGAGLFLLAGRTVPVCSVLVAVSAGTVLLSAYLAWALVARLRTHCPLCYLGHGVNVALLAALAAACA